MEYSGLRIKREAKHLVIQPNSDESKGFVEIDPIAQEIRGYNPVHRIYQGSGKFAGFSGYFVIKLSKPFTNFGTFGDGTVTANQKRYVKSTGKRRVCFLFR